MTLTLSTDPSAAQPPDRRVPLSPRLVLAVAVLALATPLAAAERHIRCEADFYKYDAAFDENELSPVEMAAARLLTPYCEGWFGPLLVDGSVDPKTGLADKSMIVSGLETCPDERPGCPNIIEHLDAAFLANAARNLEDDRRQLAAFESLKVPAQLEPVHRYYLFTARFFLEVEAARFDFLKSGDPSILRRTLCKYCACSAPEDAMLHAIELSQGKAKIEATRMVFYSRVLKCWSRSDPGYPLRAWRDFVAAHHIRETFTDIPIE